MSHVFLSSYLGKNLRGEETCNVVFDYRDCLISLANVTPGELFVFVTDDPDEDIFAGSPTAEGIREAMAFIDKRAKK